MDLFLETCSHNPKIDWLIFTDIKYKKNHPDNIKFINMSRVKFCKLIRKQAKCKFAINFNPYYKPCDMRPLYGDIFKDYIKEYRFWGHCDIDVFWGDIVAFMDENILSKYDVISADPRRICGPFTIYRNIPKINELYKLKADYKIIIEDAHQFFKFDEIGMTALLKENSSNLGIRYLFKKLQEYSTSEGKESCKWLNGKVINWVSNEELMFFHFRQWKNFKINFKLSNEIKGWFIKETELIPIFDEHLTVK